MNTLFHSRQDAAMRLHDSVCRYKGQPVYVTLNARTFTDIDEVVIHNLIDNGSRNATVKYTDPDFDYSSIPLGYCNYKRSAVYLTRQPSRMQKQGIGRDNVFIRGEINSFPTHFFYSTALHHCIMGTHPKYEEALECVRSGDARSMAFHRYLAVGKLDNKVIGLFYRDRIIGILNSKGEFDLLRLKDLCIIERLLRKVEGLKYNANDSTDLRKEPTS